MLQRTIGLLMLLTSFVACEKFLEVEPPPTAMVTENVFRDSVTATAAMAGIYERLMESQSNVFNGSGVLLSGLSTDELLVTSTDVLFREFYFHSLPSSHTLVKNYWQELYQLIYQCNAQIEGLAEGTANNISWAKTLTGEAKFLRALAYSELQPKFGSVPMALTTDYRVNKSLPRADSATLYTQVVADLREAAQLLSQNYYSASGLRSRPNRSAAFALLSRVYLYQGDWQETANVADEVLNQGALYELAPAPGEVFLHGSRESIWHLPAVVPGYNTGIASTFLQLSGVPTYATLQPSLVAGFESGDLRREAWIHTHTYEGTTYHQPYKYRYAERSQGTEHLVLLRLEEVLLNRAEARLHLGDIPGALGDLNAVRNRAGLAAISDTDPSSIEAALLQERRMEFMAENGLRFKDLQRTGLFDATMSALKPNDWKSTAVRFPIPDIEIKNNPAITQNPGY